MTDDRAHKLSSAVVVTQEEVEATGIEKKPDKKPVKDAIFSRNKRFLGTMLGHLAKAQNNMKTDKSKEKQKVKEETEARAAKKMAEYNNQVKEETLQAFRIKKDKEEEQLKKILKEHEEKEVALLEIVLHEHSTKISEYIRTKASPPLLWLPVSHNDITTKLLEDSKQEELKRTAAGNLVVREDVSVNAGAKPDSDTLMKGETRAAEEAGKETSQSTSATSSSSKEYTLDDE